MLPIRCACIFEVIVMSEHFFSLIFFSNYIELFPFCWRWGNCVRYNWQESQTIHIFSKIHRCSFFWTNVHGCTVLQNTTCVTSLSTLLWF